VAGAHVNTGCVLPRSRPSPLQAGGSTQLEVAGQERFERGAQLGRERKRLAECRRGLGDVSFEDVGEAGPQSNWPAKRDYVKPPVLLPRSPVPKHAVPRALGRAFACPGAASQAYRRGTWRRMCLANITAEVHTPVVAGGTENWVPGTIEHLAAPLVGMWLVTAGDITDCLALTADRSCYCAIPAWSPPLPSARPHDHTWVRTIAAYVPGSRPRAAAAARRTGSSGRKPLR
jgi:hypothetical protein